MDPSLPGYQRDRCLSLIQTAAKRLRAAFLLDYSVSLPYRKLLQPSALKLTGVDIVVLHFAPQRGAADIQQLRHLLHPTAGHPGGMDNRLFLNGAEGQAGGQQRRTRVDPGRSANRYSGKLLRRIWPLSLLMAIFSITLFSLKIIARPGVGHQLRQRIIIYLQPRGRSAFSRLLRRLCTSEGILLRRARSGGITISKSAARSKAGG